MARLDDLVSRVADATLRKELELALLELKRRQRFGLVFEQHAPEVTALTGFPIQVDSLVQRRGGNGRDLYLVEALTRVGEATIVPLDESDEALQISVDELVQVKRFGEPIYPGLTSLGTLERGPSDKPHHAVINAENYHALQLMLYLYEGQADCIYIDPPYNTGARDWKYNNRYVDDTDTWRHSKWLSFMEKRLKLAKRLLKPDGVLIVTIDEHEVHHLGMLLERPGLFRDYLRYMVTIVINPKGNFKANFARVEEYAFFCCPNNGRDVVQGAAVDYLPLAGDIHSEDDDTGEFSAEGQFEAASEIEEHSGDRSEGGDTLGDAVEERDSKIRWKSALRSGPESLRTDRERMFYPIYVDERAKQIVRTGPYLPLGHEPSFESVDGLRPVWPINEEGEQARWTVGQAEMERKITAGEVRLGRFDKKRNTWPILYLPLSVRQAGNQPRLKRLKTVWRHSSHDPGAQGTDLLTRFLGRSGLFTFPKSVYAVRDCLAPVVRSRPDALIIDFFAGSGTTLHATCLLNAELGGNRRCILVTNNEVAEKTATRLNASGLYRGDPEFEAHGIFEQVTRPRCEAAVSGRRRDGKPVPGTYIDGRACSRGFDENIEFFAMGYLDPNDVDLGRRFNAIVPMLWLTSGGVGRWELPEPGQPYSLPNGSTYGVLFKESHFREFQVALGDRPDVTHVWLVTDSEDAYAEMRAALPRHLQTGMLYCDYLRSFRINMERNL